MPSNFQFALVREVIPLGSVFLRVTLEGDDLSNYREESIHFRLVQAPRDFEPEWPSISPNGSMKWPEGPGAVHKPVYTARYVDPSAKTLVTDVYLHEGGRTTDWAREVMAGDTRRRVVGMLGPSGGGLLNSNRVLLASDETGFPAAARLLENLPKGATGEVLLEADEGAACGYPIDAPAGVTLQWLSRASGEALGEAALSSLARHAGAHIWFAGEREDANRLRDAAKVGGWDSARLRISSFWKANG